MGVEEELGVMVERSLLVAILMSLMNCQLFAST